VLENKMLRRIKEEVTGGWRENKGGSNRRLEGE